MILTVGTEGQFRQISEALECAGKHTGEEVTIHILPGTYHEKLEIKQAGLILEGESAENTVITYDDFAYDTMPDGERRGTFRSYTLFVDAPRVQLKNLTIENAAALREGAGQCIALYAEGEGILVESCRLLGAQDTLFTGPLPPMEVEHGGFRGPKEHAPRINGRQYYHNCYICGSVDFIFGSATAFFEDCTIHSINRPGFVTAGSSPEGQEYGYVFDHCRFTGDAPAGTIYLGRPWREYARVIIMNCELGAHIHPEGWDDWGKEKAHTCTFLAEYGNTGPGAAGERAAWTHRLTAEEAAHYSREKVLGGCIKDR